MPLHFHGLQMDELAGKCEQPPDDIKLKHFTDSYKNLVLFQKKYIVTKVLKKTEFYAQNFLQS